MLCYQQVSKLIVFLQDKAESRHEFKGKDGPVHELLQNFLGVKKRNLSSRDKESKTSPTYDELQLKRLKDLIQSFVKKVPSFVLCISACFKMN